MLNDYTLQMVLLGSIILGITSGMVGTFAVLRKQSLMGDAISHSALPGLVIAFLLTSQSASYILLIGAFAASLLSTFIMMLIVKYSNITYDGALAIILSVFFGMGMVLLSVAQKLPGASQAGLNKFLFGRAASILYADVIMMLGLGILVLFIIILFWKEFKLLCFNNDFGESLGLPMMFFDIILTSLLVISIIIGLQMVGVILMSVMIIAPPVAARQWTNKLNKMILLAGFIGALAGVGGSFISSIVPRMPTGPTIVIMNFIIVLISLVLAFERGLLSRIIRRKQKINSILAKQILFDCYKSFKKEEIISIKQIMDNLILLSAKKKKQLRYYLLKKGWLLITNDKTEITKKGLEEILERGVLCA